VVAQSVEALRYKTDGRGFDSRGSHWNWNSSRTMALASTHPLTQMITRNIPWECVELTTLPPSCAECLEICEPQPPGTLGARSGL